MTFAVNKVRVVESLPVSFPPCARDSFCDPGDLWLSERVTRAVVLLAGEPRFWVCGRVASGFLGVRWLFKRVIKGDVLPIEEAEF